jgi:apolipoprotein N-acyltransferase
VPDAAEEAGWIERARRVAREESIYLGMGATVFRPTKDGISAAADPWGRVLARLDTEISPDKVMVVNLPVEGVTTIYSRIGDTFSWLCTAAFAALLVALKRRPSASG